MVTTRASEGRGECAAAASGDQTTCRYTEGMREAEAAGIDSSITARCIHGCKYSLAFTFIHLADAFIQTNHAN